jgi:c-di-GMP-binding flagellar brake protein YcgR
MTVQRKESRKKLMAFTPVYDVLHKTLLGYVGDLTLQGVMVTGEKLVEAGKQLTLGIDFPESLPEMPARRISISARAAWCRNDDSPHYFNIGFEFIDVSPENARIIESILERYQFRTVVDVSDLES